MSNRLLIAGTFLLPVVLMLAPTARGGQAQGTTILNDVRAESIGSDLLSIDVTTPPQMTPLHFLVRDAALQDALKELHRGDHFSVLVSTDESDQKILQAMSVKVVPVGPGRRIRVLFGSAVASPALKQGKDCHANGIRSGSFRGNHQGYTGGAYEGRF